MTQLVQSFQCEEECTSLSLGTLEMLSVRPVRPHAVSSFAYNFV
jgi:hypothetical protein